MPSATAIALLTVVLAALGLRLYALNWDDGRNLHPDELYVAKDVLIQRISFTWPPDWDNLLDPAASGLNPRSADPNTGELREYPYGALPLLVTDTFAAILGWVTGDNWNATDRAYLVGRALSAVFDTLTVVVVYAIGSRVFSSSVGLFAALFAALAPMSIQLAHFFTTESWLTFFVSLTLYGAIRAAESGAGRWFAASGFAFGLAMATKGSVFALAGLIGAALLYDCWRRWRTDGAGSDALYVLPRNIGVSAIAALLGFALFEPYVFAQPGIFLVSLQRQAEIVSGTFDIPFTRVFIGTLPVVYQLEQFVRWGFGPVAGLLALTGVVVVGRRFWRELTAGQWILLCWLIGYGLVIAIPETKFLRYLAPLVPALAVTAGVALAAVFTLMKRRWGARPALATLLLLLIGSGLWTVAFERIYAVEHPRLAASRWIYANVPAGSTLSAELWDDRLPTSLGPGLSETDFQYQFITIDLYRDPPPEEIAGALYDTLDQLDYVVHSSDRIATAVPRSPWRYPIQIRFLDLLRSGQLGFTEVAEFHVTPRLGPIGFDDRLADESFINYDHPRVTIYEKTSLVSRSDFDLLMAWAIDRPWSPTRHPEQASLLLDEPIGNLPVVADARWSAAFTSNSVVALAVWVVLLIVLQLVGWPLVRFALPRFGDQGWGLARLVGLLIVGYVVWLGASARLFEFRAVTLGLAALIVGVAAWLLLGRRSGPVGLHQRRTIVGAEVTFWIVFGVFLLFRYLNPDGWHPIWGGEKPMEFAHLNATLRSAHFPPYDPWYADGYINYYYYGLYLIALCLKLTGIPTEIGFNLAQPTIIAFLASGAFSVAATLGRDLTRQACLAIPGGELGVVLVLTIGNLTTVGRLLSGGQLDFGSFLDWTWAGSRAIEGAITEFPYFTALYADLHAHVIALPMTVLAIGLSYSLAQTSSDGFRHLERTQRAPWKRRLVAQLALLMLVLGSLFPTNAWDVPVYAALAIGAIFIGARPISSLRMRVVWVGSASLFLGAGAYFLFRPFHDHYLALFGSLGLVREPTSYVEAASHLGGLLAIVMVGLFLLALPRRLSTGWLIGQPALAMAIVLFAVLLANLAARVDPDVLPAILTGMLLLVGGLVALVVWARLRVAGAPSILGSALLFVAALLFFVTVGLLALHQPVLFGFLLVASLALVVWLIEATVAARFVALLVLAAASVGTGTEIVFIADDLLETSAYRMNTVFKFSNQIWVLLSLAGAALVTRMLLDARLHSKRLQRTAADLQAGEVTRLGWARAGLVVSAVIIAGSLTYPLFATLPRLHQRFEQGASPGTLNALDWMDTGTISVIGADGMPELAFADDRAAIDWLNDNVPGSPVIAEASIGPYRCNGSRFSIATGLPTIIGWERHQQQQRYPELLPERVDDVRTLYTSSDSAEKEAILREYNVAYVIVGDIERYYIVPNGNDCVATGSAAGIAAFDDLLGDVLDIAFVHGGTTVYRVLPVRAASNARGGERYAMA
ncbi:MAG: DUF2298 domain-containing protein [Chloroflexota bacterium]|nr:DUF2298 domain-containing protein [Chloroflexota bacterium]